MNVEEILIDSTMERPEGGRIIDAAMVKIDVDAFIEELRSEKQWIDTDRNAITLFKTNGLRILLIGLRKGAEMIRHTEEGLINFQNIEGRMQIATDAQTVALSKGQMLAMHAEIPHRVTATEETIFLLTLTTTLAGRGI